MECLDKYRELLEAAIAQFEAHPIDASRPEYGVWRKSLEYLRKALANTFADAFVKERKGLLVNYARPQIEMGLDFEKYRKYYSEAFDFAEKHFL